MTEKNKNYADRLAMEFYPDKNPRWIVDNEIKTEVENRLGVQLPDDYYDFINAFGFGSFDFYVKVVNFFRPDGVKEYFSTVHDNEETMCEIKEDMGYDDDDIDEAPVGCFEEDVRERIIRCGYGFPYKFCSKNSGGCGLIYWGRTGDVDFYWNCTGGSYSVVVYMDDNCFYEFDMSFSEFLFNFLHGKMKHISGSSDDYKYEEYK